MTDSSNSTNPRASRLAGCSPQHRTGGYCYVKDHSRRAILAGIAAAPALAAPALALCGSDPIFAAIERHKATDVAAGLSF